MIDKQIENIQQIYNFFQLNDNHSEEYIVQTERLIQELCDFMDISNDFEVAICIFSIIFHSSVLRKSISFVDISKSMKCNVRKLIGYETDFNVLFEKGLIFSDKINDLINSNFEVTNLGLDLFDINQNERNNQRLFKLLFNSKLTESEIRFIKLNLNNKDLDIGELFRTAVTNKHFIVSDIILKNGYEINSDQEEIIQDLSYCVDYYSEFAVDYYFKKGLMITQEIAERLKEYFNSKSHSDYSQEILDMILLKYEEQKNGEQ